MTRNDSQNEIFAAIYGPKKPLTEGGRFDRAFDGATPEEYGKALEALAATASAGTADLRAARDAAFKTYSRISGAYNMSWKEIWEQARRDMTLERENEQ